MANELNIGLTTGLTVTAQPYTARAGRGSPISLSRVSSSGFYTGDMTGSAGTYQLVFLSGGATVGSGSIVWDGSAEVASSAPSVVQIRQELDSNSTKLANLDASVSSRLADADFVAPANADIAAVKTVTDALNTERLANVATTAIVGNLIAQGNS